MDDVSIRLAGLSFTYEKSSVKALNGITAAFSRGRFIAVMGETGAGKSTLLMALNGLVPQFMEGRFEGNVVVEGLSTLEVPVQNMTEKAGLVLQDPETQIFGITVWEDAAFGPGNLGLPIETIRRRIGDSLRLVGLSGCEERLTETLSGGEKQRLTVAGVLAMGPAVLALDEPTAELDPEGKEAIFRILRELHQEHGKTIVMAEHESDRVLEYADEVLVLQKGERVWSGSPTALFADEERVRAFGLRPPGIAEVYWHLRRAGVDLGGACPRTAADMEQLLARRFAEEPSSEPPRFAEASVIVGVDAKDISDPVKTPTPILQVRNLYYRYPNGHEALHGVTLDIREGEYVAVIGRNGAGKSTLCKHFNRLLKPTEGQILFAGQDISGRETWELAPQIGYVFQNPDHQIFNSSVLEEAAYGLKMRGLSESERNRKAKEVLAFVGLEQVTDRHPFTLGKGQRQRLAVASILALEPKVLVIDEPTTGQDYQGSENMLELFRQLHRRGHTIIAITHNMRIAVEEAGRTLIMGDGKVLKDCRPSEVFNDAVILKASGLKPTAIVELARSLAIPMGTPELLTTSGALSAAVLERMANRHA